MSPTADLASYRDTQKIYGAIHFTIEAHENIVLTLALGVLTTFSLLFAWRQPFYDRRIHCPRYRARGLGKRRVAYPGYRAPFPRPAALSLCGCRLASNLRSK